MGPKPSGGTSAPELSVLLPVRDAAATVDEAVASVLRDLDGVRAELVLVDDGSKDGSSEKLRAWAARDARIRVVAGPARGISAALNAGLEVCRASLIARMDADDEWLPGRWAAQKRALDADPGLAAVGGRVEVFAAGEVGAGMRHYEAWLNAHSHPDEIYRERYVESPLVHPAATLRREALDAVGGYREGPFPEDYDLWLRLLGAGWRLASVEERVLRWRDSEKRLTRSDPRYALKAHLALKAEHLAKEGWASGGVRIAGAGPTGLKLARELKGRGVGVVGFVEVHPRKIGTVIEGVPVVGYEALKGPEGAHLLIAVGAKGARAEVRAFLGERGWREGEHFTCVS